MSLFDPILQLINLGGPVVAILLVISVFALALILLKLAQFVRSQVGRHGMVENAVSQWQRGQRQDALSLLEGNTSPASQAVKTAMQMSSANMPQSQIEDEVSRLAVTRLHELQKGFRALDAIVQIAPLLGLFGTVLGMISAFQELQASGNAVDPSALAGGIWVALMTTAAGLAVAMPVSLVLTFFESRIENERVAIETLTGAVLSKQLASNDATEPEAEIAHAAPA